MQQLLLAAIAVFVYLFPTFFAASRGRQNTGAIFVLNLFLGWSGLGWVAALAWACVKDPQGVSEYTGGLVDENGRVR